MTTTLDLKRLQTAMEIRARELARSLAERDQITIERAADELDDTVLAAGRESSAQTRARDFRLLREVEAARNRMREGTFGICLNCEEKIAPKRLLAIPWATYCLSCQANAESGGNVRQSLVWAA